MTSPGDTSKVKVGWAARTVFNLISILLLDNKEVTRYIFEHISTEDFANDHLREIFEVLVHQWEDMAMLKNFRVQCFTCCQISQNLLPGFVFPLTEAIMPLEECK